jgi:serine kinase of HPr protein (carbohydrate metabolism regulator)
MKLSEIVEKLSLNPVQPEYVDKEITTAYTGDLLSDVMGNADDECILVTIQAHKNTIAVATLKESPAIILCNDRPIPDDMIETAKDEKIALFSTSLNQYQVSGKLFSLLGK